MLEKADGSSRVLSISHIIKKIKNGEIFEAVPIDRFTLKLELHPCLCAAFMPHNFRNNLKIKLFIRSMEMV